MSNLRLIRFYSFLDNNGYLKDEHREFSSLKKAISDFKNYNVVKISEKILSEYGFVKHTCEDGTEGWLKNSFVWINEGQFRYIKHGDLAILCDDKKNPINTLGKLKTLYSAITGENL